MLLDFLGRQRKKIQTLRSEREKELSLLDTKTRETRKFLELLNKESTAPFTDFSPKVMHQLDIDKRDALKAELAEDEKRMEILRRDIAGAEEELRAADAAVREAEDLLSSDEENFISFDDEKIKIMLSRAIACLPQDPMRARYELEDILGKL